MFWLFLVGFGIIFSIMVYHFVGKSEEQTLPEEQVQPKYTYMMPRRRW
jgi:hypothetical protein